MASCELSHKILDRYAHRVDYWIFHVYFVAEDTGELHTLFIYKLHPKFMVTFTDAWKVKLDALLLKYKHKKVPTTSVDIPFSHIFAHGIKLYENKLFPSQINEYKTYTVKKNIALPRKAHLAALQLEREEEAALLEAERIEKEEESLVLTPFFSYQLV